MVRFALTIYPYSLGGATSEWQQAPINLPLVALRYGLVRYGLVSASARTGRAFIGYRPNVPPNTDLALR